MGIKLLVLVWLVLLDVLTVPDLHYPNVNLVLETLFTIKLPYLVDLDVKLDISPIIPLINVLLVKEDA